MKKTLFGTAILALGLLTGCGESSPEDIAIKFATSISEVKLEDAKHCATENVQKKVDRLTNLCKNDAVTKLADITIPVLNTLDKKRRSGNYKEQLSDAMAQFKKDSKEMSAKLKEEIKSKYGSMQDVPKGKRDDIVNESLAMFSMVSMPLIEKEFELFKIKTDEAEDVKKITSIFMMDGRTRVNYGNLKKLKKIVRKILEDKEMGPTPSCMDKYTKFGLIDDINIIEVKEQSPDESVVRLELIKKNGKSKKVSIDVEKIQDEWKVSDMYLKTFF